MKLFPEYLDQKQVVLIKNVTNQIQTEVSDSHVCISDV